MAVDLNKVKRDIEKQARVEDRALAKLQRFFEKGSKSKPVVNIKFTTNLTVGGYTAPISSQSININEQGQVISSLSSSERSLRHEHNIAWEDIERAYKIQEAIHSMIADEYEKADKGYRGRRLYQQGDFVFGRDAAGRTVIKGNGSQVTVGGDIGYGYGHHMIGKQKVGNYGKLDVDIQKRVLERIYGAIWRETNTHLLEKFSSIDIQGSDFKKLIKGTQELIYDIKKAKDWKKEVNDIVVQATLKYNQQIKQLAKAQEKVIKNDYLVSIQQLESIGRAILGLAIEYAPIETGFLRSSGKLYVSDNDIRIIFECPYAAYVHDNPNAQHPVGRYHFLVDAAQEILPKISVWTENTGDNGFVLGNYMKQTWDRDESGNIVSDMYWREHKGYQAVYIDIDRNFNINYAHYK